MRRVTLRDVAAAAGVSVATASYAMRRLGRVPAATRRRVEESAARLGYHALPGVSEALTLVRTGNTRSFRHVFAVVGSLRNVDEHRWSSEIFAGLVEEAAACDCQIEYFPVLSAELAAGNRLAKIIRARGAEGLILMPQTRLRMSDKWWSQLAPVTIGYSLIEPVMTRVINDIVSAVWEAIAFTRDCGFRRVGLCLDRGYGEKHRWIVNSIYAYQQNRLPASDRLTEHISESPKLFLEWFERERPEALILSDAACHQIGAALLAERLPQDRVVMLDLDPREEFRIGFKPDYAGLAGAAFGAVRRLVERRHFGIPDRPLMIAVRPSLYLPERRSE